MVDLSNPDWQKQLEIVNQVLDSLEVKAIRQLVANQIDRCENISLELIRRIDPKVLYLSATNGSGMEGLKYWLTQQFWSSNTESNEGLKARMKHG